tara:strand:+ start:31020 stop:31610 length:591 start_codon:yes stop_codon:yes gene_type:complete
MEHICHNKKCIFVHVPKVAGRSVAESLGWDRLTYGGHFPALFLKSAYPKIYEEYFVFGFCRNPLARAISAYNYFKNSKTFQRQSVDEDVFSAVDNSDNFDEFCINFLNKSDPLQLIDHLAPQYYFLCDEEEKVIVDYLGKLETIEEDYKFITDKLGVDNNLRHENKGVKEYKASKEAENIIKRIYKKDYKIFNYEI